MQVGIIFLLVSSYGYLPFGYEVAIYKWENRIIDYDSLTILELEERAEEDNDTYARHLLKKREEEKKSAYYLELDNGQLYSLWKSNGDLKAFEQIKKRFMIYKVERVKYSRIATSELQKMAEEKKDSHAWFEIQSSKRLFANGGEEFC